jgi:hypothetical protein
MSIHGYAEGRECAVKDRYAVDKKMREHLRGEVARRKGVSPQKPMNRKIEGEGEGDGG